MTTNPSAETVAPTPPQARRGLLGFMAPVAILVAVWVAFWTVPGNIFELDDWHTIKENPAIRSVGNIPRFFSDASTSSILKPNQDYRPLLQATYAINFALSGYNEDPTGTDSWHWTNILIHFGVAYGVFLIGRRLVGSLALAPIPGLNPGVADGACFAAAIVFAIHPIASGPVNYISARSSSLTALFVLLATLFYLRGLARPHRWWRFGVSSLFFALGMFTKVEAVSFLAIAFMAEVLLNPAVRSRPIVMRPWQRGMYLRLAPLVGIAAIVLTIWYYQTALRTSDTRAGLGVTPKDYLVTQFGAWWYYIGQIVAPFNFIADYPSYPLSRWSDFFATSGGFLAFKDPKAVFAFVGWWFIGVTAIVIARRVPAVTFLVGCFFVCLAPHSSIVPLAEPVNEHRPYLPDTAVFLLLAIGLGLFVSRNIKRPRLAIGVLVAGLAIPLVGITRQRNAVWHDSISLWSDAAAKAPESARVQMNLGVALMRAGRYTEAEARFKETIRLAPGYHYAYSNLGVVLGVRGDMAGAKAAHDTAVRLAPGLDLPYYWRARFFAGLHDVAGAAHDFMTAESLNHADLRTQAGAAETLIRLGRAPDAEAYIKKGEALDRTAGHSTFEAERAAVRAMLGPLDANGQMERGAEFRLKGQWVQAEWCYREAVRLDPNNVIAHVNLGIVLAGQDQPGVAGQWFDRAVELGKSSDMPYYWRGRFRASRGEWDAAIADFTASRHNGGPRARDDAALIETMLAAGKKEQADAIIAAFDQLQAGALERERADFRAQVFKKKPVPPEPNR